MIDNRQGLRLNEIMCMNHITSTTLSEIYTEYTHVYLSPDKIRKIRCGIRKMNPYECKAMEQVLNICEGYFLGSDHFEYGNYKEYKERFK